MPASIATRLFSLDGRALAATLLCLTTMSARADTATVPQAAAHVGSTTAKTISAAAVPSTAVAARASERPQIATADAHVATTAHRATITLRDDHGHIITLPAPARRAITAAPHATELVYAAGAGSYLAGIAQGSNYPSAALALPSIGTTLRPNLEIATALQPDLLIAWQPAVPDPLADLMRRLKVPVFYSDPRTLDEIPDAVETMGRLFGTEGRAIPAAEALRARLAVLSARYTHLAPVRVFIQAGLQPIYTLNGHSIVSDAVRLCGGINAFADISTLAPQISLESVLAARPDAVVAGSAGPDDARSNLQAWQQHGLPAAQQGYVFSVAADALYRPGPRLIDVTEKLCEDLDQVRAQRSLTDSSNTSH
ncbi:cobalamin-binding protein [Bordetella muralis]|uniref:cobalamin-binding protein n=1 Tax=Bordetella muralis TaxID=1649130 RepID=UPI0039EF509D